MSTATEISRLTAARNTIRDKLIELGLATSTAKLDTLATTIDGIANRGAVSATVQEGDTYTIPAGYHNGSGTVSGVAGGGNYNLQSKSVTPTKSQQSVTPDTGYYGLSDVTVNAIPEAYQNITGVTATASDVLSGKVIVTSSGTTTAGTMANNGAVNKTLDATSGNQEYTVPAGYHNGSGKVKIVLETKSATPSTASQSITPTNGKVLSSVTVNAIPSNFADVTGDNVVSSVLLTGYSAHGYDSTNDRAYQVIGVMPNNGAVSSVLDTSKDNQSYTIPAGYHNGSGTVSIVLETKSATPSTSLQNITPTTGKVLSKVTVNAIPSAYQDVTAVTASASDVLAGQVIVASDGTEITGTMVNNGTANYTFSSATWSEMLAGSSVIEYYTGVAKGYHSGSGVIHVGVEQKTVTPTTSSQNITPSAATKLISKVTVNAIPSKFGDTTNDTAVASNILAGVKAHTISGGAAVQITGTMTNNGAISGSIDGLTITSYSVPSGYTSGGSVSLTSDIETALAAI